MTKSGMGLIISASIYSSAELARLVWRDMQNTSADWEQLLTWELVGIILCWSVIVTVAVFEYKKAKGERCRLWRIIRELSRTRR